MNWKKRLKILSGRQKRAFEQICAANGLRLDYAQNIDALPILQEIFVQRVYADYFPFYTTATIVDVGAHYGYFSLFAALNSASDSRILALEPSHKNVRRFTKNIRQHQFSTIELLPLALSSKSGTQALHLNNSETNSLFASADNPTSETVQTITLEKLFEQHQLDRIDFLKLDCEGAEYDALYSTPKNVLQGIQVISMEFHDLKKADYTGLALATFLQQQGFQIVKFAHSPTNLGLNYGKLIARLP